MLDGIVDLINAVLRPLSISIILAAICGGLFLGKFYNQRLKLPERFIYHKFVAGAAFLFFLFFFRLMEGILRGTPLTIVGNPLGWIGITMLWGIFCLFIWAGEKYL